MSVYSEVNPVQKTTADCLKGNLGWDERVFAMDETFVLKQKIMGQ